MNSYVGINLEEMDIEELFDVLYCLTGKTVLWEKVQSRENRTKTNDARTCFQNTKKHAADKLAKDPKVKSTWEPVPEEIKAPLIEKYGELNSLMLPSETMRVCFATVVEIVLLETHLCEANVEKVFTKQQELKEQKSWLADQLLFNDEEREKLEQRIETCNENLKKKHFGRIFKGA